MRWFTEANQTMNRVIQDFEDRIREKALETAKRRGMEAVTKDDVYIAIGEFMNESMDFADRFRRHMMEGLGEDGDEE